MKKMISGLLGAALLVGMMPLQSHAATIQSGKDYVPSKSYVYKVYDKEGSPKYSTLKCSGPVSMRECLRTSPYGGYTHLYSNKTLRFGVASSDAFLTPEYTFPMKAGKTYKNYKIDYYIGKRYPYKYKVVSVNMTKKIGQKTYKNVIRIKNPGGGYTFIAKNHGIVLVTYKTNGKQHTYYKAMNYWKK